MSTDNFDAEKIINQMIAIFTTIPQVYEQNETNILMYEQEENDLVHGFEFLEFNNSLGYKMAKELKENRSRRRNCKDQNELMKQVYEMIMKYSKFLGELKKCQTDIQITKNVMKKRTYTPRIRTEMRELFIQASKEGANK